MVASVPAAHSPVTASDMELLDMLTSMSTESSFPHMPAMSLRHQQQAHPTTPPTHAFDTPGGGGALGTERKRPLATLQALRRPPIDPIILAASLSSGPHVTRHHFHHSFAGRPDERKSLQMPASERRRRLQRQDADEARHLEEQHQQQQQQQRQAARADANARRRSSITTQPSALTGQGKYASCDACTSDEELEAQQDASGWEQGEPSDELRSMYISSQAPRSVRLQRKQKLQEALAARGATQAAATAVVEASSAQQPAPDARAAEQISPRQGSVDRDPAAPPTPSEQLDAALVHRKAVLDGIAKTKSVRTEMASLSSSSNQTPSVEIAPATASGPQTSASLAPISRPALSSIVRPPPLSVRCYARTRIPTPHGEIFCHLYRNNHDAKEHLALVIDPSLNDEVSMRLGPDGKPPKVKGALRSRTLDERWGDEETEMERIVRGAYVGRLGPGFQMASEPLPRRRPSHVPGSSLVDASAAGAAATIARAGGGGVARGSEQIPDDDEEVPALVRIHSECYTGETLGSQRCDCGEQLDEAIRLIHESGGIGRGVAGGGASSSSSARPARGVVVYLRQEGRGIGLLDKLMAYNLQDMGHDTVSANILLGHLADARKYDVASAILRDLGVGKCRLLTNNPEKMEALEAEGVQVLERVAMVPRMWRVGKRHRHRHRHRHGGDSGTRTSGGRRSHHHQRHHGASSSSTGPAASTSGRAKRTSAKDPRSRALMAATSLDQSILSQAEVEGVTSDSDDDADEVARLGARHQGSDVDDEDDGEVDGGGGSSGRNHRSSGSGSGSGSGSSSEYDSESSRDSYVEHVLRRSGATMLGASVTRGPELERYLRTKVERMGHLLELPPDDEGGGGGGPAAAEDDDGGVEAGTAGRGGSGKSASRRQRRRPRERRGTLKATAAAAHAADMSRAASDMAAPAGPAAAGATTDQKRDGGHRRVGEAGRGHEGEGAADDDDVVDAGNTTDPEPLLDDATLQHLASGAAGGGGGGDGGGGTGDDEVVLVPPRSHFGQ